jgi:hypothetical protein
MVDTLIEYINDVEAKMHPDNPKNYWLNYVDSPIEEKSSKLINHHMGKPDKYTHVASQWMQEGEQDMKKQIVKIRVDNFVVINPEEIEDLGEPVFNLTGKLREEEYLKLLVDSLPYILEYEASGSVAKLEYNAKDSDAELHTKWEENCKRDAFVRGFLDSGSYINVEKTISGKYRCLSNGLHRLYVAKKYGQKVIVHVYQEEVLGDR